MRSRPLSFAGQVGYVRAMRTALALVTLIALAACGKADNEPGPGGVTVGEARALDEAAEMVEGQALSPDAIPPQTQPAQTQAVQSPPAPKR